MITKQLGDKLQDVAKFGLGDTKDVVPAAREENALPGKTKFDGEADTTGWPDGSGQAAGCVRRRPTGSAERRRAGGWRREGRHVL